MHDRPAGIRDSDVAAALARQWALTVREMSYLPVGFGGYHWLAVDQAARPSPGFSRRQHR